MFSFNYYKNVDLDSKAVDFSPVSENHVLNSTGVCFDNGLRINLFDSLSSNVDISFNNKSGILLTNLFNNSQIFSDNKKPDDNEFIGQFESLFSYTNQNNKFYSYNKNSKLIEVKTSSNPSENDKFKFIFRNSKVSIEIYNGLVFTILDDNTLDLLPRKIKDDDSQFFDYLINDNNTYKQATLIIYKKELGVFLSLVNKTSLIFTNIPILFYLSSLDNKALKGITNNSLPDSFYSKYQTISEAPYYSDSKIENKSKDFGYTQNYLGVFPYENYKETDNSVVYELYIHSLKNYQTSEYNYTINSSNRVYNKIYTGTNQKNGLKKIYLGYQTDTIALNFQSGKDNYFYVSPTIDYVDFETLSNDGAFGGLAPLNSDRIITNNKSNFQELDDLKLITPIYTDLTFLCYWYSQDNNWYKRFFNSAKYTLDQALKETKLVYNKKDENYNSGYYDIQISSDEKLRPGILYNYKRVSNEELQKFYSNFDTVNIKGKVKPSKVLSIKNFKSSELIDESAYKNNGTVYTSNPLAYKDNYISLDGNSYVVFPANDSLLLEDNMTLSFWLKVPDWNNINSYQIFGNYFNSGYGLFYENKAYAPIITLLNSGSNTVYNFNYKLNQISHVQFSSLIGSKCIIQRLPDTSYWVFVGTTATKYDMNGKLLSNFDYGNFLSSIDQVEALPDDFIFLYDNNKKYCLKIYTDGIVGFLKFENGDGSDYVLQLNSNTQRIEIRDGFSDIKAGKKSRGIIVPCNGNASTIDNNENVWEVIGVNLYKNRNIHATVGITKQIICDNYNNLWLLGTDESYIKFDGLGNFAFKKSFAKTKIEEETNCPPQPPIDIPLLKALDEDLPFISTNNPKYIEDNYYEDILVTEVQKSTIYTPPKVYTRDRVIAMINTSDPSVSTVVCNLSSQQNDCLVLVDYTDNEMYLIDQNGEPLTKLNLYTLESPKSNFNFSTYGDITGYQAVRRFKRTNEKSLVFKFSGNKKGQAKDSNGKLLDQYYYYSFSDYITYNLSQKPLSPGFHNFTITKFDYYSYNYNSNVTQINFYIDSILVNQYTTDSTFKFNYQYRNSFLVGDITIQNTSMSNILNLNEGYKLIGDFGDLRMYNFALSSEKEIKSLYYSSPLSPKIEDMRWNMKVGLRNYVEEITHWYQFQNPGSKSKYYNINVHNLNVNDSVKQNLELAIKNIVYKISPSYSSLYKINWK